MSFDDACLWTPSPTHPNRYHGSFETPWFQGRGAYGGLVAASFVDTMTRVVDAPRRPLRSLTVNFCAPALAVPTHIDVEIARAGSTVSHVRATLIQNERNVAIAQATFARARESHLSRYANLEPPESPRPRELDPAPYLEGIMPAFTQFFELRYVHGSLPFSGADRPIMGGWIRLCEPSSQAMPQLAALLDAWAPAVLPMYRKPGGAATVDLSYQILDPLRIREASPDAHYLYFAESRFVHEGYAEELATLWDESGHPLAVVRQNVVLFA